MKHLILLQKLALMTVTVSLAVAPLAGAVEVVADAELVVSLDEPNEDDASGSGNDPGQDDGGLYDTAADEIHRAEGCGSAVAALQPRIDDWNDRVHDRWMRFVDSVGAAYQDLSESRAGSAAWAAAVGAWDEQAAALHAESQEAFQGWLHGALGPCASWVGSLPDPWSRLRLPYLPPGHGPGSEEQPDSYYEQWSSRWEGMNGTKWSRMALVRDALQAQCDARMEQASNATQRAEFDSECSLQVLAEYREQYHELRRTGEVHGHFGGMSFGVDSENQDFFLTGKYVGARGSLSDRHFTSLYCQGPDYADVLSFAAGAADFRPRMDRDGNPFRLEDANGDAFFEIHDTARCTTNYASTDRVPAIHLDLSDRLTCQGTPSGGLRCLDGDRELVALLHEGTIHVGEGNDLRLEGSMTLFVTDIISDVAESAGRVAQEAAGADPTRHLREAMYEQAVRDNRIGVEALIIKVDADTIRADHAAMGDFEFHVRGTPFAIDVFVESELGEGKSISLDLKGGLFLDTLLGVEVYDVAFNGTETPIVVREAQSLADALDPLDDGEAIEYWVEEGAEGVNLVVSIPHFSQKRIHLEPDIMGSIGIPAPSLAWLAPSLAATAVLWRRRMR